MSMRITWNNVKIIGILSFNVLLYPIEYGYRIIPFKDIFNYIYLRSKFLQKLFRYQLNANPSESPFDRVVMLCNRLGYQVIEHNMITEDKYLLTIYQVIDSTIRSQSPYPVLIMHGFMQDCESLLINNENIIHNLLINGYDVWLGNNRGTKYSDKHLSIDITNKQYWNFSIDEMADYDLTAIIDYIKKYKLINKVIFIGFSQGSTQLFINLSNNLLSNSILLFIALSPIVKINKSCNNIIASLVSYYPKVLYQLLGYSTNYLSLNHVFNVLNHNLVSKIIKFYYNLIFKWNLRNTSIFPYICLNKSIHSSTSMKSFHHWCKIFKYGHIIQYNSNVFYDISYINIPIAIFAGKDDDLIDHEYLQNVLNNCIYYKAIPNYEHLDLIWADNVRTEIADDIIKLLAIYTK